MRKLLLPATGSGRPGRRPGGARSRARRFAPCLLVLALVPVAFATGAGAEDDTVAAAAGPTTVIAGASTPDGGGHWLARADGTVVARGNARHFGDASKLNLNAPLVGMATTPTGQGYWLVAGDGGIFSYGDARFFGSMGGQRLNQPVFSMTPTATGRGYWLVARDGGIFSFGDARFFGSMGGKPLNQPINGITRSVGGRGYRMVARDGGIFSFGDAEFVGSLGGRGIGDVVGMAPTPSGRGYWILTARGDVTGFGDAKDLGDASVTTGDPAASIFSNPRRQGFIVVTQSGRTLAFGDAPAGSPPSPPPVTLPAIYAIRITGEGASVDFAGRLTPYGEPFVIDAALIVSGPLDTQALTRNGVNAVDIGIKTTTSPIVGRAGALWFGTNTSMSALIGTSPAIGPSNIDVAVVTYDSATRTVTAQLDGNVFGSPFARVNYLNIYNLRSSIVAQIHNAFAGGMTLTFAPDGRSVTGQINLGGSSGFGGPNVSSAYVATFAGVIAS
jgi:hypothetical protein